MKLSPVLLQPAVPETPGTPVVALTADNEVHSIGVRLSAAAMADPSQRKREVGQFALDHAGSIGDLSDLSAAMVNASGSLKLPGAGMGPELAGGIALFAHGVGVASALHDKDTALAAINSLKVGTDAIGFLSNLKLLPHSGAIGPVVSLIGLGGDVATFVHDFRHDQHPNSP